MVTYRQLTDEIGREAMKQIMTMMKLSAANSSGEDATGVGEMTFNATEVAARVLRKYGLIGTQHARLKAGAEVYFLTEEGIRFATDYRERKVGRRERKKGTADYRKGSP